MKPIGTESLLFLVFVVVLIPLAARQTSLRLKSQVPGRPVTRLSYWKSAVLFQGLLFFLAWVAGSSFDYKFFAVPHLTATDVLLSVAALGACLGLRLLARLVRSPEEWKKLSVFERAPRNSAELAWFVAAVLSASVTEEVAYRGVGWSILWYSLGDPWISAAIMAVAFALAHWNQGWKSGIVIVAFAAVFHALVWATETLVLAMVVHAAYDFYAGGEIRKMAMEFDKASTNDSTPHAE